MKTRDEMVYDFMVALASNSDVINADASHEVNMKYLMMIANDLATLALGGKI